jgi:hypothetical protein
MRLAEDILAPEFRKAQSKPATDARRADAIQEIIDFHARDLWRRTPSKNGNSEGTATTIRPAVNEDLRALQKKVGPKKFPKAWEPAESADADSVKKEIGRIARRVRNVHEPDD